MAHVHPLPKVQHVRDATSSRRMHVFSVFASLIAVLILAANVLMLPIPYLGLEIHPQTHIVIGVEPGSASARAGVRVGDAVVRLYDHAIDEVFSSITFVGWIAPRDQPIPLVVERNGQVLAFQLAQDAPVLESQVFMGAMAGLALVCWVTGYVVGVSRNQSILGSQVAAYFWLGIGGVVGVLPFALAASVPLLGMLAWLIVGMLVPLSVYMHVFFPPRVADPTLQVRAQRFVVGAAVLVNGLLLVVTITQPSVIDAVLVVLRVLPLALVVGFGGSAVLLQRAYRQTHVAHTRRQIRLIAAACGIVACGWVLLSILPLLTISDRLLPRNGLFVLCGLVPLAYLVSIGTRDLYRVDRVAGRCLLHAATITVLGVVLFVIATRLQVWGTVTSTLLALSFVVFYRPVQHLVRRVLPSKYGIRDGHHALDHAVSGLAQTLDADQLVATLANGAATMFDQPAFAIYTGDIHGSDTLHLHTHARLADLPEHVPSGALTTLLRQISFPLDSRAVYHRAHGVVLTPREQQLIAHPGVAVWGPIRHSHGHLLGLLLIGMRGDLDPYRPDDIAALHRLLSAAALAFTNSAAYVQQQESESMIRQLYRRLQSAQDSTARDLAHELHDDIINVHVRLNIFSLTQVVEHVRDAKARNELNNVLESLRTMSDDLRRICEHLYPTGLDDVFGLGAVLRGQLRKEQARWCGHCRFEETGQPLPIAAQVQREALRIVREAVTNAIKHAHAQTITVQLAYPEEPQQYVQLTISDDGVATDQPIERVGHFGLRYMRESASAAGGTFHIARRSDGGTQVVFAFRPISEQVNDKDVSNAEGDRDAAR